MTLNIKPAGASSEPHDKATVVGWEIETMEIDVGRLGEQLRQTRNALTEVNERIERFQQAVVHLSKEQAKLAAREAAERKMLRDRRVALIDLKAEIE